MKAKDFEILRNIEANGRVNIPMARKPVRVATMINEELFNSSGHQLIHQSTVFLEDIFHDWQWKNGQFRYYTRVADRADVLVVYELASETPTEEDKIADRLQSIINDGYNARDTSQGGRGHNTICLCDADYRALKDAINYLRRK